MFTLYSSPLSANGRKVLALARHLGLSPGVKLVDVYRGEGQTPEFLAINPSGKIPALVDGDLALWESNAILQYLAEAYGGFELWSHDARERADIIRWLFWESSQWQPALSEVLAPVVAQKLGVAPAMPLATVDWSNAGFRRVTGLLENHLRGRRFLCLGRVTLADFSVAAMLTYARAARFPFDVLPSIGQWYRTMEALDAWQATAVEPW